MTDISSASITKYLDQYKALHLFPPVTVLEITGSTNEDIKKGISEGIPDMSVIVAKEQTVGKGRRGRSFNSQRSGIYMSIGVKRHIPIFCTGRVTMAAALCVRDAFEALLPAELETGIKWMNDIYFHGKKACGILCEAGPILQEESAYSYVVIGIGINYGKVQFPEELLSKATSVENELSDTPLPDPNQLIAVILSRLSFYLDRLEDFENDIIRSEYKRSLFVLNGGPVSFILDNTEHEGIVTDILPGGELVVSTKTGDRTLDSGEISIRIN